MTDEEFLQKYEELLDKDYCNCNEMNCIDNNAPRRILNITKELEEKLEQKNKVIEEAISFIEEHSRFEPPNYEIREFYNAYNLNELSDILNKGVDE